MPGHLFFKASFSIAFHIQFDCGAGMNAHYARFRKRKFGLLSPRRNAILPPRCRVHSISRRRTSTSATQRLPISPREQNRRCAATPSRYRQGGRRYDQLLEIAIRCRRARYGPARESAIHHRSYLPDRSSPTVRPHRCPSSLENLL